MAARINGITMNYRVSGPERMPAVVLHHALATNLTVWDELTVALEWDFRVIRMDARGHGSTEAPKGSYDFETLTQDVVALIDHLGIGKVHFLGLSMGGMVGQYLGLLRPDLIRSLCLVSTSSAVPASAGPLWDERIRVAATSGMSALADATVSRWLTPTALTGNSPLVARLKRMIETTKPDGYIGWCHAIRGLDITSRLNGIRLPVRIIVGSLDPSTPPAAAEAIHRAVPGSELVVVPGLSHMLHVEDPAALLVRVQPFLAAHPASP